MQKTLKKLFILSALALSTSVMSTTSYANDDVITDESRNRDYSYQYYIAKLIMLSVQRKQNAL